MVTRTSSRTSHGGRRGSTRVDKLTVNNLFEAAITGLPVGSNRPAPPAPTPLACGFFRSHVGPGLLLLLTPLVPVLIWITITYYDGSISAALLGAAKDPSLLLARVPLPSLRAAAGLFLWSVLQAVLLCTLPGPTVKGPISPAGEVTVYRGNGVAAWFVTHVGLFFVAAPLRWWRPAVVIDYFGEICVTLNFIALAFCFALYVKARTYPSGRDTVFHNSFILDFFQGQELYPRMFGVSLKQLFNCRVSMMGWSVVFCCAAAAQIDRFGYLSSSAAVTVFLLVAYLFKFFLWEDGYFGSIDIIHDRVGFYIFWGVLVWVPSVYCLPAYYLVDHPVEWSPAASIAMGLFGVLSIVVNYWADLQRQRARRLGYQAVIWGQPAKIIRAPYTDGDGVKHTSILLASGWWGVARHFHYVPELLAAATWTFPAVAFTHYIPWFYCTFLFVLLMDRARRDELKCAKKYGKAWTAYCKAVPYRVMPGVY